jgi:hypothetical protein
MMSRWALKVWWNSWWVRAVIGRRPSCTNSPRLDTLKSLKDNLGKYALFGRGAHVCIPRPILQVHCGFCNKHMVCGSRSYLYAVLFGPLKQCQFPSFPGVLLLPLLQKRESR